MALATTSSRFYTDSDYLRYAEETSRILSNSLLKLTISSEEDEQGAKNQRKKIELLKLFKQIVQSFGQGFKTTENPDQCFHRHCVKQVDVKDKHLLEQRRGETKTQSLLRQTLTQNSPPHPGRVTAGSGQAPVFVPYTMAFRSDRFKEFLQKAVLNSRTPERLPERKMSPEQEQQPGAESPRVRVNQPTELNIRATDVVIGILGVVIGGVYLYQFIDWVCSWF